MPTNPTKRRWIFCGIPALILVIVAVAIGVVVALRHSPTSTSTSGSGLGSSPSSPKSSSGTNSSDLASFGIAGTGKNGTIVTTDLGVNYTYINWFGGSWAQNPESPYSVGQYHEIGVED
jgi:glucan 1,3-beta-glucosidase